MGKSGTEVKDCEDRVGSGKGNLATIYFGDGGPEKGSKSEAW